MRRHLGFSVEEWRALPWWQERLYLEQLHDDLVSQTQAHQAAIAEAQQPEGESAEPAGLNELAEQPRRQVSTEELGLNVIKARFGPNSA